MAFSPDGQRVAGAGADDKRCGCGTRDTGEPLGGEPSSLHEGAVRSVAFSPDGRRLASAGDDGTVRVWDAATRQPLGER